jgi:hypothetical protein
MFEREREFVVTGQAGSLAEARVHEQSARRGGRRGR